MSSHAIQLTNESAVLPQNTAPIGAGPRSWESKSMSEYDTDVDSSDVECPTCGRTDFANQRGMRCHHSHVHGESLATVNKNCEWCGDEYETQRSEQDKSRFCSTECHYSWKSEAYSDPEPDYCDAQCPTCGKASFLTERGMKKHHYMEHGESIAVVEQACEQCGEEYRVQECQSERSRFCSNECCDNWRSENIRGKNHPLWKPKETLICEQCEDEYKLLPSLSDGSRFCSRDCLTDWQSENLSGENSHKWKGGHTHYNNAAWRRQRELAIDRDNNRCQLCGMTRSEHYEKIGRDLEVHHIKPVVSFDEGDNSDELSNLITFCRKCHTNWQGIPLVPDRR
jgi:hypothetical protein